MHKTRSQLNFANDMLEQVEKMRLRFSELTFEEFCNNEDLQLAVERRFEIIGEAASNIDLEMLLKVYNDRTYWRIIKDMRNRITHEYWGVSLEIVYKTAKEKMEELEEYIKKLIDELKNC